MAESDSTSTMDIPSRTETNNNNPIDHNTVVITNQKLTSHNYLSWSRTVELFITGRGKEDYLYGRVPTPSTDDPKYRS